MKNIAVFASGDGSNAEAIARYFTGSDKVCLKFVLSNRENAYVHQRMARLGIPSYTFPKDDWNEPHKIVGMLQDADIDLVILAGFLAKIEKPLTTAYKGRIINIHPSLLPKYGGKGMWGHHVHEAVLAAGEKQSGITIHTVTEVVDGGEILFQATCKVLPSDTPDTLASRVHSLEHTYYPLVIANLLDDLEVNSPTL